MYGVLLLQAKDLTAAIWLSIPISVNSRLLPSLSDNTLVTHDSLFFDWLKSEQLPNWNQLKVKLDYSGAI